MKMTDDYKAKIKLWAANPQVVPDSPPLKVPGFRSKRFQSHAEMNAWKLSLLKELARQSPEYND
jgi:hypothetical protein